MSDYSSQPVEDFDPTDYALRSKDSHKFKRAKPLFEKSLAGRLAMADYLHGQGYESSVEVKWTHKQLRPEFSEVWEVGPSNAKCIAHIVENSMGFVQEIFSEKTCSYDFDLKRVKKTAKENEQKASILARQHADFKNLSNIFGSSSVRHVN